MLDVLVAPDGVVLSAPRGAELKDYRVAVWLTDPALETDREVVEVIEVLVGQLQDAGVSIDEVKPIADLAQHADDHRQLRFGITLGIPIAPEDLDQLLSERERLQQLWRDFFDAYDVLLAPTAQVVAIEHDLSGPSIGRTVVVNGEDTPYQRFEVWTGPAGFAGLPATTAPVGLSSSGLPVGVQIIGPHLEDRTTIDFARRLEELRGGFLAPPVQ